MFEILPWWRGTFEDAIAYEIMRKLLSQMPYCVNCGNQVGDTDLYCTKCGARQPVEPQKIITTDPLSGITPRTATMLCYIPVVGWIASIVVLAARRFRDNRTVRFHAYQGLYLFVAWLIVEQVVSPIFRVLPGPHLRIDKLLLASILFMWIFMLVKASHEQPYSLPIIGDLAQRSAAEH
jgi:uncharacterized membrane protein